MNVFPLGLHVDALTFLDNGPYSFALPRCCIVGVSGISGVGKSQLLRALVDVIPHGGLVYLDSQESKEIAPARWRQKVAMVPAEPVWWYERVFAHFPTPMVSEKKFLKKLDLLGFEPEVMNWHISRLSTGEKQRLGLLRGICKYPEVILLDEPTASLDPFYTERVEQLLIDYVKENDAACMVVSHDGDQLARMADQKLVLLKNSLFDETTDREV